MAEPKITTFRRGSSRWYRNPLTGITLPFLSYGGSSLLANYVLLGLLLRSSDSSAVRPRERPDEPTWAEKFAAWRLRRRGGTLSATSTIPRVR